MSKTLTTKTPFLGSFVHLTKPSLPPGETDTDKARYQITIILPKKDPFWKDAAAAIKAQATEKWGKIPAKFVNPIRDGDENVDDDGNLKYPETAGCYTLQASTKRRPGIVDAKLQPITDPDELYSGAFYRATVGTYAWDHPTGGKGVSFNLNNVQKVRDGEPLDGSTSADKDFADFAEEEGDGEGGSADDLLG